MKKRIISVILCLFMLLPLAVPCLADYEDGDECPHCGHYHWDSFMCDDCGCCSEDCSNDSCYSETHCSLCGGCLLINDLCASSQFCMECVESNYLHCEECGECHCFDFDLSLCGDCGRCEDCAGDLCEECGFCEECWGHCPICEECDSGKTWCESGGDHCEDCCEFCEDCDRCVHFLEEEEGIEICEICGRCMECCIQASEDAGCECEMCMEDSDWEDHVCETCGVCFCVTEQCEICGLCLNCCEQNSNCGDGMCCEDDDYDYHFCSFCGACFHDADQCETCADYGELLCIDCCAELSSSEGCDCGVCIHSDEWDEHFFEEHTEKPEGYHIAKGMAAWSYDEQNHWHECCFCEESEHYVDFEGHKLNEKGVCVVCGYRYGGNLFITVQPKNVKATVTDVNAEGSDPLSIDNNKASFSCSANGEGKLTFTWYRTDYLTWVENTEKATRIYKVTEGPTVETVLSENGRTSTLTVSVSTEGCVIQQSYYCVVTDEKGNSVISTNAVIRCSHNFVSFDPVYTGDVKSFTDDKQVTHFYHESPGHKAMCNGESCGKTKGLLLSHNYSDPKPVKSEGGDEYLVTYCEDCGAVKYIEQHEHSFAYEDAGMASLTYNSKKKQYSGKTDDGRKVVITQGTHSISCSCEGCNQVGIANHDWSAWQIVGTVEKVGDKGGLFRECMTCGYQQDSIKDPEGKTVYWTFGTHPVTVESGKANRDLVQEGDILKLTYFGDGINACTGWKCTYQGKEIYISCSSIGEGEWKVSIPSLNGSDELIFAPRKEICNHQKGTKLVNSVEAMCLTSGYTGDKVCTACGRIISAGSVVPAPGTHSGTLTLIEGTKIDASCTTKGYEGDFRCSDCGEKVRGKHTSYAHEGRLVNDKEASFLEDGYTGDRYCIYCGKTLNSGKVIPKLNVADYVFITNQSPYYTSPVQYETGDRIRVSFDAVLDKKLQKQGYKISAAVAYHRGLSDIGFGEVSESHAMLDVSLTSAGTYVILCMITLFDQNEKIMGYVSTEMSIKAVDGNCVHLYKVVSDSATCTHAGIRFLTCEKCGKTISEISASGQHEYRQVYDHNSEHCWYECQKCGSKKDIENHSFKKTATKEISCTESDVTYRCTRCQYEKTVREAADNHEYNVNFGRFYDADNHWMFCVKCGYKFVEKHTYQYEQCTFCGIMKGKHMNYSVASDGSHLELPVLVCIHGTVTVDTSKCSASILNGATIEWWDTNYDWQNPIAYGKTLDLSKFPLSQKEEMIGHTLTAQLVKNGTSLLYADSSISLFVDVEAKAADCSHEGNIKFKLCLCCDGAFNANNQKINPVIPATGNHKYKNNCDSICGVCGFIRVAPHNFNPGYDNDEYGHWQKCADCKYKVGYQAHNSGSWVLDKAPSCTSEGKRHKECVVCNRIMESETLSLDHNYEMTLKNPGCETEGSKTWVCLMCGDTVTETISATGHKITLFAGKPADCMHDGTREHYGCAICGKAFMDEEGTAPAQPAEFIIPETEDNHIGFIKYGTDDGSHWGLCLCGASLSEKAEHSFDNYKCTVCMFTLSPAEPENPDGPDDTSNPEDTSNPGSTSGTADVTTDDNGADAPGSGLTRKARIAVIIAASALLVVAVLAVVLIVVTKKKKGGKE